jgi:hypothetical protein
LFRGIDKDLNGILNEAEFREMARVFEEQHNIPMDTERLLMAIDPYNYQQITFSQCVALFSSVILLEKL